MDDLLKVWSVPAILGALAAGLLVGFVIARIVRQPRWRTDNKPVAYGWLVGILSAWFGFAFYLSQVLAAFVEGDFLWQRIASRYGMWLVASIGVGVGTWLALRRKS